MCGYHQVEEKRSDSVDSFRRVTSRPISVILESEQKSPIDNARGVWSDQVEEQKCLDQVHKEQGWREKAWMMEKLRCLTDIQLKVSKR